MPTHFYKWPALPGLINHWATCSQRVQCLTFKYKSPKMGLSGSQNAQKAKVQKGRDFGPFSIVGSGPSKSVLWGWAPLSKILDQQHQDCSSGFFPVQLPGGLFGNWTKQNRDFNSLFRRTRTVNQFWRFCNHLQWPTFCQNWLAYMYHF